MKGDVYLTVYKFADLNLSCFSDCRVTMAEIGDANSRCEIQHFSSRDGGDITAGAAFEHFGGETANPFSYVFDAELGQFGGTHGCDL